MTDILPHPEAKRPRIEVIDVLRGLALLCMASYHFTWDLDFHGYVTRGLASTGGWRIYARCIATSFLFLVGVSLVLAHARGIRWRSFGKREAQVVAGAAAITAVTWFVTPDSFVFFGILHQIALASLVGLLFLRVPPVATLALGAAIVALPFFFATPLTDPKPLAWIGLAARQPVTNDYVPIFPWTGVMLIGIATATFLDRAKAWGRLASLNPRLVRLKPLAVLGRHSLLFYLLHQPILFGLVAAFAAVSPPDRTAEFMNECMTECAADAPTCLKACACVAEDLKSHDLLEALLDRRLSQADADTLNDAVQQCRLPLRLAAPPPP